MHVFTYNAILSAAAVAFAPWYAWRILVSGKYRASVGPKLGFHPPGTFEGVEGSPRIWVHAVSVGEVTAASPIVAQLRLLYPDGALFLSTGTETGQAAAARLVPEASRIFYFPLDIPPVIRGVMDRVNPDLFAIVETELWPNFIRICAQRSIRVVMVNGRLSPRSFEGYRATRFFWKGVLDRLDAAGVISETDAARLRKIGMDPSRIEVVGNAKYDGLVERATPELREKTALLLDLSIEDRVIVGGSTHEGEETILVDVYEKLLPAHPGLRLVLVPRHVDRAGRVMDMLQDRRLETAVLTDIEAGKADARSQVVVVDSMGRLFGLYGVATVVFCGGSLVPKGGQNVLEASAWGKAVLHGPHMDDFSEEGRLLDEAGGGITVHDGDELAATLGDLLSNGEERRRRGAAGRRVVEENRGAAARYAGIIARVYESYKG